MLLEQECQSMQQLVRVEGLGHRSQVGVVGRWIDVAARTANAIIIICKICTANGSVDDVVYQWHARAATSDQGWICAKQIHEHPDRRPLARHGQRFDGHGEAHVPVMREHPHGLLVVRDALVRLGPPGGCQALSREEQSPQPLPARHGTPDALEVGALFLFWLLALEVGGLLHLLDVRADRLVIAHLRQGRDVQLRRQLELALHALAFPAKNACKAEIATRVI
mmetsp:Transcript_11736/g.22599  ORF Transcript_11736/g.22599 Transcript_11736/m.22599 type:complete len:223 (-) Transcript_11736:81-749(-)